MWRPLSSIASRGPMIFIALCFSGRSGGGWLGWWCVGGLWVALVRRGDSGSLEKSSGLFSASRKVMFTCGRRVCVCERCAWSCELRRRANCHACGWFGAGLLAGDIKHTRRIYLNVVERERERARCLCAAWEWIGLLNVSGGGLERCGKRHSLSSLVNICHTHSACQRVVTPHQLVLLCRSDGDIISLFFVKYFALDLFCYCVRNRKRDIWVSAIPVGWGCQ